MVSIPIKLKRSTVASSAPVPGDLTDSEVALNTVDEALYMKNSSNVIKKIADGINAVFKNVSNEFTKSQNFNATTLTDAANISWDADSNQVASVTLAGNRTLDNPTNMKDGATYVLTVKQDGVGTRTLSFGSAYKFPSGVAPTLSTAINSVDILTFISDGTNMYGVAQYDFK